MQQLQDDVLYALDGLKPGCGLVTQQEAAVQLAEALATRRGRAALRWAAGSRPSGTWAVWLLPCSGTVACLARCSSWYA